MGDAALLPGGAHDLVELRALVRWGAVTVAAVVDAVRRRAEATSRYNAYTHVDDADIAAQVSRLEALDPDLPLYGMPLAVKDLIDQAGYPTTSGVRRPAVPAATQDARVVARLRSAGAVLVGRANLDQHAAGVTNENPHYGFVGNPHDIRRVAGGSSGGSAAAVVLGSAAGAVGTDTGGSIRIPSALSGAVGLKPTYASVSTSGVRPLAWSLDHVGPIARSVRDALLLFHVMSGAIGEPPPGPDVRGLRFAVVGGYFHRDVDVTVLDAIGRAADALRESGARETTVPAPELDESLALQYVIYPSEAATAFHDRDASGATWAGARFTETLDLGERITAVEYLTAVRAKRDIRRRIEALFDRADVLVVPTTATVACWRTDEAAAPIRDRQVRHRYVRMCCPFNQSGHPAISVPFGSESGLPIGVQLVARHGGEATLAAAAGAMEARLPPA